MKKKIIKRGFILLLVCILSIGSAFSAYAACAHTFYGSYVTIKPATCTESGTMVGRCTQCGVIVSTITIPATGHSWYYVYSSEKTDYYYCRHTGCQWVHAIPK